MLFYVLPLTGKLLLLFNWQVIFLATVCTVLFATQPRLSFNESKEKKATDRYTIWLIILVSGIGQIVSLIEWAYFPTALSSDIWKYVGVALLIIGTIFRLYAIRILGKYFSATVQIKAEHKIITAGPYKYLRHPSYTGAYLAMVGCALFLNSMAGLFILGIGMLIVYHIRIRVEEKTLVKNFGIFYKLYASRTDKMIPLVW